MTKKRPDRVETELTILKAFEAVGLEIIIIRPKQKG